MADCVFRNRKFIQTIKKIHFLLTFDQILAAYSTLVQIINRIINVEASYQTSKQDLPDEKELCNWQPFIKASKHLLLCRFKMK